MQHVDMLDSGNKAGWMEYNLYMQNQLLRDSDVMSMIHGVEIRVPFLDEDVVRTANKIHPAIKYKGSRPKQILIDIFEDMLPSAIWNRSKMGFSFPFEQWLRDSKLVRDKVNQSSIATRNNYDRFMKGKLHWSQLMSLIILQHRQVA
jgi:asparagine synthase (glutamine-hydrolysing)